MTASELQRRILSFLQREVDTERRELQRLRALSIEDRVLEGDCIRGLAFKRLDSKGRRLFTCRENLSRVRAGDPVRIFRFIDEGR
jgi:hypothetical protein